MMISAISPSDTTYGLIIPVDKFLSFIPSEETIFMHSRIREAPQGICRVCDEVTGSNDLIILFYDRVTQRAFSFASEYKCHIFCFASGYFSYIHRSQTQQVCSTLRSFFI